MQGFHEYARPLSSSPRGRAEGFRVTLPSSSGFRRNLASFQLAKSLRAFSRQFHDKFNVTVSSQLMRLAHFPYTTTENKSYYIWLVWLFKVVASNKKMPKAKVQMFAQHGYVPRHVLCERCQRPHHEQLVVHIWVGDYQLRVVFLPCAGSQYGVVTKPYTHLIIKWVKKSV